MDGEERVVLTLSRAEALVLFEWLARCDEAASFSFDHEAEQRIVWTLESQLEKALPELLSAEYRLKLERARNSVLDGENPS
ncbi:hypothetical protein V3W47_06450 [Deinococcus sp. YIM 134068]|uniref:hypothetical protein n=1 Tax=Deinococcus lichenicola TaxID=3118910 RepID=UPI002F91CE32